MLYLVFGEYLLPIICIRYCLWILGNDKTLSNSESSWAHLVCDAKDRGCFFNADDDENLAKAIVDVKKEFNQLDDLLKGDSILFRNARWKVQYEPNFSSVFIICSTYCITFSYFYMYRFYSAIGF